MFATTLQTMVRVLIFIFFLACGLPTIYGQNCNLTLSGVVQEKDGTTLPGATLLLSDKAIITSAVGTFEFLGL